MNRNSSTIRIVEYADAAASAEAIAAFSECTDKFTAEILEKFANKWVAIYHATVAAADDSLDGLIAELVRKNIQPNHAAVRFMGRQTQTLVLPRQCCGDTSTTSLRGHSSTAS